MSPHPAIVRSEAGLTLVEMLMVVAILGIIVLPLTNAMVVGLRSSDRTAEMLVASADRQMLTNYLPADALSATAATTDPATTGCLDPEAGSTRVLLLTWSEYDGAVTNYAADYRLAPGGTGTELLREQCVNSSLVTKKLKIARDATAATATVVGGTVAITVTDSLGQPYTVSGTRRVGS